MVLQKKLWWGQSSCELSVLSSQEWDVQRKKTNFSLSKGEATPCGRLESCGATPLSVHKPPRLTLLHTDLCVFTLWRQKSRFFSSGFAARLFSRFFWVKTMQRKDLIITQSFVQFVAYYVQNTNMLIGIDSTYIMLLTEVCLHFYTCNRPMLE